MLLEGLAYYRIFYVDIGSIQARSELEVKRCNEQTMETF